MDKETATKAEKRGARGMITVEGEIKRLTRIYKTIPDAQFKTVQGLIVQAARLRVMCDTLWADIQANGYTTLFAQSDKTPPYERERPQVKDYYAADKAYQSIIKQLTALKAPSPEKKSKLDEILGG